MKSNSFIKRQKEAARKKKQAEKQDKKRTKTKEDTKGNWENMMAYVDQDGNISTEPPSQESFETPKQSIT